MSKFTHRTEQSARAWTEKLRGVGICGTTFGGDFCGLHKLHNVYGPREHGQWIKYQWLEQEEVLSRALRRAALASYVPEEEDDDEYEPEPVYTMLDWWRGFLGRMRRR